MTHRKFTQYGVQNNQKINKQILEKFGTIR